MAAFDPYGNTDKLDDMALETMSNRLENRGQDSRFRGMVEDYISALGPGGLNRVAEIGCGTGVATRVLANHPDFKGRIDASDMSAKLIDTARGLADDDGCADKINFTVGDALQLSASEPYDAVIAHTVISHVPDCQACLSAMARAVGRDGRIVVFDGDYASTVFGAENDEDSLGLSNAMINGLVANPRVMRQLPWLAKAAGLVIEDSYSYLLSEVGSADFFSGGLASLPVLIPKSGVADEQTVRHWVDQQFSYSEDGIFFASMTFYTYLLKPAA